MNLEELRALFADLLSKGITPMLCDTEVPLYDSPVACGEPNMSYGEILEKVLLPKELLSMHPEFLIPVRGDSMKDVGIETGDIVKVIGDVTPSDGDIVLAYIDGEFTLKTYCEDEDGQYWLVPQNEKYQPILLDDQIMAAMKTADAPGREAEKEYKKKLKERSSSSKVQKGEPLEMPTEVIRYLPSKTSNAVFFRRCENAKEIIGGELMHLHLYMFDSELDSAVGAQKSDWAGKHDLELKAFHNEFSGVDFANNDSVNDVIQVFWNQVITGTPVSLAKKFNRRNINDGFCTRVSICKIWPEKYKMLARRKSEGNYTIDSKLKEWGFRFDSMKGELPIQPLVDHCYNLCEEYAKEAGEATDDVLDLLRKRAVFYAIWYTIPRIYGRQWEQYRETGKVEVNDDDLQFASIIYEAVIYWQDFFFGKMLQATWDDAENDVETRKRNSKANDDFAVLPKEFEIEDLEKVAKISKDTARQRIFRWKNSGYVEAIGNTRPAKFKKIVNAIVV